MLYESFKGTGNPVSRATHAPAWEIWEFQRSNGSPKGCFLKNFVNFFRSFSGAPKWSGWLILMFFDVLKLPGPSQNGPGSIWDRSFFDHFFIIFLKSLTQKVNLVSCLHPLRINRFEILIEDSWFLFTWRREKNTTSPNDFIDSQTQHFGESKSSKFWPKKSMKVHTCTP